MKMKKLNRRVVNLLAVLACIAAVVGSGAAIRWASVKADCFYDFRKYYYPATRAVITGQNPYAQQAVYSPPWTFYLLAPLAILPYHVAATLNAMITILVLLAFGRKAGLTWWGCLAVMCSVPAVWMLFFGQTDWLVYLAFFGPQPIGMLFLLTKPQVGIGVAVYWFWKSKDRVGLVIPLLLVAVAGLVFYGPWPMLMLKGASASRADMNVAAFPWLIPLAVYLWVHHVKRPRDALVIGPCLSPHLMPCSWLPFMLLFGKDSTKWCWLGCVLSWAAMLVWRFGLIGGG